MKIMAETNHKPDGAQNQGRELDQMLDAALATYAAVEPRSGLEERILANLRAEGAPSNSRAWRQWGLAGALAVVVIIAGLTWKLTRTWPPAIANHPQIAIQNPSTQETNPAPQGGREVTIAKHSPARRPGQRRGPAATPVAAHPKLDHFPSRQPLSAEEIALVQYVRSFPKEAQLVAQAQEEFALETEKVMNDAGSEARPSSSIQQER